jgi:hypothetical protein
MKNTSQTGTTRQGRRTAIGLIVAVASLSAASHADAQSLFSNGQSPLSNLPASQYGTAGTTTVTSGAGTSGLATTYGQTDATQDPTVLTGIDPNNPVSNTSGLNNTTLRPAQPANAQAAEDLNQPYEEDLNQSSDQALDPGTTPLDGQQGGEQRAAIDAPPGVRLGTFVLRPTVSQSINTEVTKDHGSKDTRNYLATGFRGTLTSDWSRHALTVTGEGVYQRNINGSQNDADPHAHVEADLRLDLADDTTGHVIGRYDFQREDVSDPNAIGNAAEQAGVHQYGTEASIERSLGRLRGLAAIGATREIYTDAKLSDGSVFSMKDRNRTAIDGRLRLGYELSPAIIPFAEVALGHTAYDRRRDSSGYQRSSDNYAGRTGIAFDMGEKLNGEIAGGYEHVVYEDPRLKAIDAFTLDSTVNWSPRRGTDVNLGLRTAVQDSTTAGQSGWTEYQLRSALAHQLRDHLVARLTGSTTFRDFQDSSQNNITWITGAGLTWSINRYVDLTGDVEYERTAGGGSDQDVLRAGIGLAVKR